MHNLINTHKCIQLQQVHRSSGNWCRKRSETFRCMARHLGLYLALRSKSSSECMRTYNIDRSDIPSRLVIKHTLRAQNSELSIEDAQMIENRRTRLEGLINVFEHQANTYLHHSSLVDHPTSSLGDYDEFDNSDVALDFMGDDEDVRHFQSLPFGVSDDLGMEGLRPEGFPILLPSSLGWEWCNTHGAMSLASKEAQLRYAQANDAIQQLRLALGFKSAIFRTQVRPAKTQRTKTRAWKAVHDIDSTAQEHARIYCMAQDAYHQLHSASNTAAALPPLCREDLNVETLVLGSEATGQCNKQPSWICGFGEMIDNDETWMDDCKSSLYQCCMDALIHICDSQQSSLASCKGTVWAMVRGAGQHPQWSTVDSCFLSQQGNDMEGTHFLCFRKIT